MAPGYLSIGNECTVVPEHVVSGAGVCIGFVVVVIDNLEDGSIGRQERVGNDTLNRR